MEESDTTIETLATEDFLHQDKDSEIIQPIGCENVLDIKVEGSKTITEVSIREEDTPSEHKINTVLESYSNVGGENISFDESDTVIKPFRLEEACPHEDLGNKVIQLTENESDPEKISLQTGESSSDLQFSTVTNSAEFRSEIRNAECILLGLETESVVNDITINRIERGIDLYSHSSPNNEAPTLAEVNVPEERNNEIVTQPCNNQIIVEHSTMKGTEMNTEFNSNIVTSSEVLIAEQSIEVSSAVNAISDIDETSEESSETMEQLPKYAFSSAQHAQIEQHSKYIEQESVQDSNDDEKETRHEIKTCLNTTGVDEINSNQIHINTSVNISSKIVQSGETDMRTELDVLCETLDESTDYRNDDNNYHELVGSSAEANLKPVLKEEASFPSNIFGINFIDTTEIHLHLANLGSQICINKPNEAVSADSEHIVNVINKDNNTELADTQSNEVNREGTVCVIDSQADDNSSETSESDPDSRTPVNQIDLRMSLNNLPGVFDSNLSSSSSEDFPDKVESIPTGVISTTLLYNNGGGDSTVTTTDTDIAVNSFMSIEQVSSNAEVHVVNSSNTCNYTEPNLVTESVSAVQALLSAELSDNTVHSNTIEYDTGFGDIPQYKPSFMSTVIRTPKSYEPSVIELNCAVASILGENSNTAASAHDFTVASANDVSTSSVDQTCRLQLLETSSADASLSNSVQSSVASTSDVLSDLQGDLKDISEQLVTQSNIEDTPQESEGELIALGDLPPLISVGENEIEQNVRSSALDHPLSVDVNISNFTEHGDSNIVSSTQEEKTETVFEISSPESQKNMSSLKITIGKDENLHSILKIYDPNEAQFCKEEAVVPKITIKPIPSPVELQSSPRFTMKPIKVPETSNPKIIIKPVVKPEPISPLKITLRPSKTTPTSPKSHVKSFSELVELSHHSPKITIKPVLKPGENNEEGILKISSSELEKNNLKARTKSTEELQEEKRSSPKLLIKPIVKPPDEEDLPHNLKITIKPIVKSPEGIQYIEDKPKITIKPIVKPEELITSDDKPTPRITIKPVIKPSENEHAITTACVPNSSKLQTDSEEDLGSILPLKLNIKPIIKPDEFTISGEDKSSSQITNKSVIKSPESERVIPTLQSILNSNKFHDEFRERISNSYSRHSRKLNMKHVAKPPETSILQTFLKSGELPQKPLELIDFEEQIKQERIILKIAKPGRRGRPPLSQARRVNPLKLRLDSANSQSKRSFYDEDYHPKRSRTNILQGIPDYIDFYSPPQNVTADRASNIFQQESSLNRNEFSDPLSEIPVFTISSQSDAPLSNIEANSKMIEASTSVASASPAPRKRGRPRKIPLQIREEFKDPREEEEIQSFPEEEPLRPKRSCRGPSGFSILAMRPRKPRGSRGRRGGGSPRGTRGRARKVKESILPIGSLGLFQEPMVTDYERTDTDIKDGEFKSVPLPTESGNNNREVVIYEEETRMSAENSSRAHTPAKQVLSTEVVEESQSSVQSNATTESGEKIHKSRKGRVEVHQEPEGEVISADKLAEYSWGGGGPYMLQEQVAQFLGIKSFKRKYPGIHRRTVDMQERDFIRESCLASEAMCDMGLTAVKSEDILDIMYTDFQHKYEEYCKHQRDRQAKDVSNKQKALSLAASQEKNKLDIVEQAVQSAYQWNASFNKTRREQRQACMDLQTFTVHYPKGKMKQINKLPIGNYPLSLVPGQYSDYYKKYTSCELSSLPLNTIGCGSNVDLEDSHSDGSGSDSDSSSSDSDSSSSASSDDCKVCNTRPAVAKKTVSPVD